eukprot:6190602-Pleurochrysis_carterae.AAC.1
MRVRFSATTAAERGERAFVFARARGDNITYTSNCICYLCACILVYMSPVLFLTFTALCASFTTLRLLGAVRACVLWKAQVTISTHSAAQSFAQMAELEDLWDYLLGALTRVC